MNFSKTKNKIKQMVEDQSIPGASFSFITGMNVESDEVGLKQVEPSEQPVGPNDVYDIASLTKVVGTLPVIMRLLQDGRIHLDDSVSDYLPEWQYPEVTIRHLLTHTSGIEGYIPNRNEMNINQLREALLGLHVGDNFDKKMKYADVNYIFLGWIAGLVMGIPIQPLITQMVLNPLGLNETTFHPDAQRSVPTTYNEKTGINLQGKVHDPKAQILGDDCGSAGMFSTLNDLSRFAQWMLQINDRSNIFNNETFDELYTDQTPMGDGTRSFGWALADYDDNPYIWQSGYTGVVMVLVRERKSGFVFLSNRVHPQLREHFMEDRNDLINTYLDELFN